MSNSRSILINGRFLTQRITGVQSFAISLCREIKAEIPYTLAVPSGATLLTSEFNERLVFTGKFGGHAWEQTGLGFYANRNEHTTLLNLCNTGPLLVKNQVVTIHDLAFFQHPEWFTPLFATAYNFLIPRLARKSRAVITVSETMKAELSEKLNIPARKIFVVPNKVNTTLLITAPQKPKNDLITKNNFFLMTGTDDPRKNFAFVEKIFAGGKNNLLVIAGGRDKNFRDEHRIRNKNIVRLGYVTHGELRWLYENASGFINPSRYEGFGLPNLEAMAFGCPLFCSDIPVFREICGDAAEYFENTSRDSLEYILQSKATSQRSLKTSVGKTIFTNYRDINRTVIVSKALSL